MLKKININIKMRREYSCANFDLDFDLDSDDDSFRYLKTENNQPSAPNLKSNISTQVNESIEDWIYIEDTIKSLNYTGKPILNSNLYEFTCEEDNKKFLAKIGTLSEIKKEANILHDLLSYDNILHWKRYFTEEGRTYILYEHCKNIITLEEYLKQRDSLPEYEVKPIITELIKMLKYLKSQNIIHRNLNLSNIIMTKGGGIKVMGFNKAIRLSSGQNYYEQDITWDEENYVLIPESFSFSEEIKNDDYYFNSDNARFSYESDLWAVGRIMYYLLLGSESDINEDTDIKKIFKNNCYGISNKAKDCLRRLLEPNPKKRHKLNQIFMLPFFK